MSKSSFLSEELLSSDEQSQNSSHKDTLPPSQDNMSNGTTCHHDDIQIDDNGSQEVSSWINDDLAPSILQARGSGGNGGTTKNKKPDIDIKLNEVVTLKTSKVSICPRITLP